MTPELTQALVNRLRRLQDATKNGRPAFLPEGAVSRLDLTERRLLAAIRRANTPGPTRDGYPGGTPGAGGQDAPQSTTEGAALHRAGVNLSKDEPLKKPRDEVLENTAAAYAHLQNAVNELAAMFIRLDLIDARANPGSRHSNAGGDCLACDRHVEGTGGDSMRGKSPDRLRRGMCSACYSAWSRDGKPDIMVFRASRRDEAA